MVVILSKPQLGLILHRFLLQNCSRQIASSSSSPSSLRSNVGIGKIQDGHQSFEQLKVGILGAPFFQGQPHAGLEKSPSLLRQAGIVDRLRALGHDVKDFGDVDHVHVEETGGFKPDFLYYPANNVEYAKKLSMEVERILSSGRLLLTIGGDHSVGMATVHGHLRAHPDACVLWVDAHGDINTPDTALTGHFHGMPLSFNMVELASLQPKWPNMEWFKPMLDAGRLAFVGLRDVDPLEKTILDRLKIPCYSMREVDEMGISEVVRRALKDINPNGDRPLHVSFDIDALDPVEAPATGTPVRGGLTLREGMTLLEDVFQTGTLRALDLVEVNVNLGHYDDGAKTVLAARHLVMAAMGYYRGGRQPIPEELKKSEGIVPKK